MERREKPPAAGLANLLSSHWRCYRERGWKSRAADSHVISYSLLACSFLAGLYACVCVRACMQKMCCTNEDPFPQVH